MKQTVFAMIAAASLFIGAISCSQQPSAKDQTTVPAEFTISKEKLMECIRPNAMILAYPVILADAYVNEGSLACVSGAGKGSPEDLYFGLDKHVDAKTPPAFLWHTAEDTCVPVENSLYFALALSKEKIPFELHVFPEGSHGMSVCTKEVGTGDAYNGRWVEWSVRWLFKMFF